MGPTRQEEVDVVDADDDWINKTVDYLTKTTAAAAMTPPSTNIYD
jgi:hypothetical protein